MKYKSFPLSFAYFFVLIQASYAMEEQNNSSQIIRQSIPKKQLISITNRHYVRYLIDNVIIMRNENDCSIINVTEDKEIKKIGINSYFYVAKSQNGKKIALTDHKTIQVYDVQTGALEWEKKEKFSICSFVFNPLDNHSVVLRLYDAMNRNSIFVRRNYVKAGNSDDKNDIITYHGHMNFKLHPKKPVMYIVEATGSICEYNLSLERFGSKIQLDYSPNGFKISHEGIIALGEQSRNFIFIIDFNGDNVTHRSLKSAETERFLTMAFYSKGSILATISKLLSVPAKTIMRYWDLETLKSIYEVYVTDFNIVWNFSFSPHGKEFVLVSDNKSEIYVVPFEIIYKVGTKEKFSYFLFVIKNLIERHNKTVQEDIERLLVDMCLELFRR
jgi:WD40 repeat protein